jgi:hypothetical protein
MFERFHRPDPYADYVRRVLGDDKQTPPSERQPLHAAVHHVKLASFECLGCGAKLNGNSPCLKDSAAHFGIVLHYDLKSRTWHGCYDKQGGRLEMPPAYYNS